MADQSDAGRFAVGLVRERPTRRLTADVSLAPVSSGDCAPFGTEPPGIGR